MGVRSIRTGSTMKFKGWAMKPGPFLFHVGTLSPCSSHFGKVREIG
jgi:hypothetical protein